MQANGLNDEEVAMMCDIARSSAVRLNPRKKIALERLLSEGFIELSQGSSTAGEPGFKVTAKGQKTLDDQGVGANEA